MSPRAADGAGLLRCWRVPGRTGRQAFGDSRPAAVRTRLFQAHRRLLSRFLRVVSLFRTTGIAREMCTDFKSVF